jgi:hypothetical protein
MRIEFTIGNWLMGNYHGNLELGSGIAVQGIGVKGIGVRFDFFTARPALNQL